MILFHLLKCPKNKPGIRSFQNISRVFKSRLELISIILMKTYQLSMSGQIMLKLPRAENYQCSRVPAWKNPPLNGPSAENVAPIW